MKQPAFHSGLILEDIPQSQAWLASLVQRAFPGIHLMLAASCEQATTLLKQQIPDIALIDLALPDVTGTDIIHALKKQQPQCLCIISTAFDDDRHVFSALKAGADGYLMKDQDEDDLLAMLEGIMQGRPPLSPAIARKMLDFFQQPSDPPSAEHKLTARETDILTCIGKGYTVAKTAELNGITYNTAASYVKEIYRKLNIRSRAQAASEAIRLGLIRQDY